MENTKKIFLVDSRFDLRNESRHHSALDRAISSALSADLSEKKIIQYEQALLRYQKKLTNIESAASELIKGQPNTEEKSIKDKIIEAVESKNKPKALQVYDDLSAYAPLTVDKQGRLIQNGSVIEDSNLIDLITHDVKKKKGQKLSIAWEIFSTAKKQAYAKKGRLLSSRVGRSKVKRR